MPDWSWEFSPLSDFEDLTAARFSALPDSCFWKSRLTNLFARRSLWAALGVWPTGIFILSGPAGSRRHMTGRALIGELPGLWGVPAEEVGYLSLRAEDFPETMTAAEAMAQVEDACTKAEEWTASVLVLDGMDTFSRIPAAANALADNAGSYFDGRAVICYTEDETALPHALTSVSMILRTNLPSREQRQRFLGTLLEWEAPDEENEGETLSCHLAVDGMEPEEMAEETDGCTFADLELLVRYLRMSGLERPVLGHGLLDLHTDRETFTDCLHMVRNRRPAAAAGTVIAMPVAVSGNAQAQQENGPQQAGSRQTALAGRQRSIEEEFELIHMTD